MTHSALLILGGGLLTCVLAALVFGSGGSAEDKRLREERKLLRALEAQRRIRDAQLARADRRRRPVGKAQRPPQVEPPQEDDEQATARREQEAERPRAEEREAALEAENAQRRAAEQERKREEKEQEAARKAQRKSEEAARRRTEQERKAALKAAAAERRAAEQQRQRTEKEQAAARAQREAERAAAAEADRRRAVPMPTVPEVEEAKPLAELPLYSWAHRIENDDANPRTP